MTKQSLKILQQKASITVDSEQEFPMECWEGGCRLLWKQQMFFNAYPAIDMDRPKYGELNIFNYLNEASPRFGGCFF